MKSSSWPRIVLCGLIVGVIWHVVSAVLLFFFAPDFLELVREGGPHPRWGSAVFFAIDLVMGIWAMWLYSVVATRYATRARAALVVGVAWWLLKTLQSAKWVGLGFAPVESVLVTLATTLVAIEAATLAGARLYRGAEPSPDTR